MPETIEFYFVSINVAAPISYYFLFTDNTKINTLENSTEHKSTCKNNYI